MDIFSFVNRKLFDLNVKHILTYKYITLNNSPEPDDCEDLCKY